MSRTFNKEHFRIFLKEAYSRADKIYIDFNTVISDFREMETSEFEPFLENALEKVTEFDNGYPYTRLTVKKNYSLYSFLNSLTSWNEIFCEDNDPEIYLCAVYFMENNKCIAGIESHFRNYDNQYFMN